MPGNGARGVRVYQTAIRCAENEDLKEEWEKYLEETENHVRIVADIFNELGMNTDIETPGREIVRAKGGGFGQINGNGSRDR
ncbi:MAG: DUF892 family protein [Acidimicrobiia bacterium]